MKKLLTLLVLLLMFVSFFPVPVSAETKAGIGPNSFFYFFDTAFENINLFFTFDSEKKARKALIYAEERLAEVEESASENKPKAIEKAMKGYESRISFATEKSKELEDKTKAEELLNKISESTDKHQAVLVVVLENVSEEAKEAILKAIEVSKRGQEKALKEVLALKEEVIELKEEIQELKEEVKGGANEEIDNKQTDEIEELKKQIQDLKIESEKQEVSPTETKVEQSNNIITLPNGAIVEMGINGDIVRYIKEASQKSIESNQNQTQNTTSAPTTFSCTQDTWSCSNWSECSLSGNQIRSCNKDFECSLVITPSPNTSQTCLYTPLICNSFDYSDWSSCSSSENQTRSVISSSPNNCTGGNPVLSQSCTYTPSVSSCTASDWSCSDWGACSQNSSQTRTCDRNSYCQGGVSSPTTSQSCTPEIIYSDYNFDYEWGYEAPDPNIYSPSNAPNNAWLTCPATYRNIQLRKTLFEISFGDAEKLQQMKNKKDINHQYLLSAKLIISYNLSSGRRASETFDLEQKDDNIFVFVGNTVAICGNSAVVAIKISAALYPIDVPSELPIYFYPDIIPQMSEWEVWDYTTNKPVKILK